MRRPALEVADIIRTAGESFQRRYQPNGLHRKVLAAIERCRTAALGGHRDRCTRCSYTAAISYNSCRNRHCPKCQTNVRDKWLDARQNELLPVSYAHVVFTLPRQLARVSRFEGVAGSKSFVFSVGIPKVGTTWIAWFALEPWVEIGEGASVRAASAAVRPPRQEPYNG